MYLHTDKYLAASLTSAPILPVRAGKERLIANSSLQKRLIKAAHNHDPDRQPLA